MPTIARAVFPALGTGAVILVSDQAGLAAAHRAVAAEVDAIDRACSRFRPDSELSAINAARGQMVAVSSLLFEALEVALRAARLTDGDVTPTVGEAIGLLGYDRDFAAIPESGQRPVRIAAVPGWRLLRLDRDRDRGNALVQVPAGVRLDLGATAKALAADRAAARASEASSCGVLVSLGGDIATAGAPPDGGWAVRVTDWHASRPDAEGDREGDAEGDGEGDGETIRIHDGALATSSTTVRRWARGGEQLHHIIDPGTGGPAAVVWRTVSVAAATCFDANTAATAALIRGERSPAWLGSLGLPARLVHPDGQVVRVGGWPAPQWEAQWEGQWEEGGTAA
jgi:FAD:protein FMN transferase